MPRTNIRHVFKKRKGFCVKKVPTEDSPSISKPITQASPELPPNIAGLEQLECEDENDIINIANLSAFAAKQLTCRFCHGEVSITISRRVGLAAEVSITCLKCGTNAKEMNATQVPQTESFKNIFYDINIRMVYAMRAIGRGYDPSKLFCGLMNLPSPHTRSKKHETFLAKAVKEVSENDENELEVCDAALVSKEGNIGRWKVFKAMKISPGKFMIKALIAIDKLKKTKAERVANKALSRKRNLKDDLEEETNSSE